jgi:hypothetical protein
VGALVAAAMLAASADAATPAPARVQVTADEFTLTLSRASIRRGPAVVELLNLGEDDHDLALRRQAKGARTFRIAIVAPGGLGEVDARLVPGRYRLWCTIADHRARGMHATLVVRRR